MNAGVPSSLEYAGEIAEIPSATHQMISWGELVGKEDKLAMRAYLKATSGYDCTTHASGTVYVEPAPKTAVFVHGAQMKRPSPADGQRGSTLSAFVADFAKRDGAWAAAARDPQCAKALGRLRRRVAELDDPMVAARPSEWAHKIMNGQDGSDQGPRHQLMLTSLANPLTYNAMLKPKPKPRAATRRAAGEAVGVKIFSANDDNLPAIHPDDFSKVLEGAISAARPWCTYSVPNNVWLVRVIKGLLPDAWWHAFNYALVKTLWKTGVSLFRGEALPAPPVAPARARSPKRK